ncbi:MAG: DUF4037 domain-containing protein [Elainella sp.]
MNATNHSIWRISLARRMAPDFIANPKVGAAFVFGSAALGFSDQYSDLELGFVWSELPSASELQATAQRVGVRNWQIESYGATGQAWLEQYDLDGMKVEAGHWASTTLDGIVTDVVERYDVTQQGLLFEKQTVASHLQNAVVLHGEALINRWQDQLSPYPEELAVAMVQQQLKFRPFHGQEILAERNEIPLLYENHSAIVRWLLNLLFGLNRIYHPGFKWTSYWVNAMALKPPDLFQRLERVFQSDAISGTRELGQLVQETFDLVEQHLPQVDLTPQRTTFSQLYPRWKLPNNYA